MEYKSSVLKCDDDDDCCPTCKFLAGDRNVEVLVSVIENLDAMLAETERQVDNLLGPLLANRTRPTRHSDN
jgi:hypothetical protein